MAKILFIDDNVEEVSQYPDLIGDRAEVSILYPDDVDDTQLKSADLVLVDYMIDNWPSRDRVAQIGLKPLRGVALTSVLRDYANDPTGNDSPVAFAVLTGHIGQLSGSMPVEYRRHVLAASNNLEWIFLKNAARQTSDKAVSLANAVSKLPPKWHLEGSADLDSYLSSLFALTVSEWKERAVYDFKLCRPPLYELSEWSHGLAIIRWFLHQILPYPSFLLDSVRLALRLRVTPESLATALANPSLRNLFSIAEYRGILSDFDGLRWWRSGVESILWERTEGELSDVRVLSSLLHSLAPELVTLNVQDPVICLDQNYHMIPDFQSTKNAVRIQPDYWPSFAEPAWTTIELAREHPHLRMLVIEQDQSVLAAQEPQ